jgi:hypothetical protein
MAQVATTANVDDVAYKVRDFAHISNGVNHVWDGNCASYETHATQHMPAIHHLPGQNKWGDKCAYITPGQSSVLTNGNNACGSFAPAGWGTDMLLRANGKKRRGDGSLAGGGLPGAAERLSLGHDVRARLLRRGDERANDCADPGAFLGADFSLCCADIRTDVFPHD